MSGSPIWDTVTTTADTLIPKDVKPHLADVLQWRPGKSPLSTHTSVVTACLLYFAIIFGGQAVMSNTKPMSLRPLFVLHNLALSAGSAILLAMMLEELVPIIYRDGWFAAICAHRSWTPRLERLYIFNYLFKYWELADTVFLVAKKKPLQFLHVYHHTATAVLCYTQLNGRTSVSWVPISLNLTVHVLMYYYYFVTAAFPGHKIWWKRYLTTMQIAQFIIDLFIIYYATYSYFAAEYVPWLPTRGSCAGTEGAALLGCALLSSYLVLFIAFYRKTYKPTAAADSPKDKHRRRRSSAAAHAAIQAASGEGPSGGLSLSGKKAQ